MYISVTEVDAVTKIPCTEEPQRTGPSMPNVKGLVIEWSEISKWPIEMDSSGKFLRAPKYFGTCDDDADITLPGVLQVLTEQEYMQKKHDEFYARKPFPSWVWDSQTMTYSAPMPYPTPDSKLKYWVWNHQSQTWSVPISIPTDILFSEIRWFWHEEKGWYINIS